MPHRNVFTRLTAILCAAVVVFSTAACSNGDDGTDRITLLARAPERGNWSPQEIRVERGRQITIEVRNVDIASHSFYLPALGLDTGPLKPGDTQEVTFTPEFAGRFLFICGVWCSDYHMWERGYLIVE